MNCLRPTGLALGTLLLAFSGLTGIAAPDSAVIKLAAFDYHGVRLRESRWLDQFNSGRDYYLGVSDDDILHGYRAAAGLPAPGQPLGGWCAKNSDIVFGQWLSGMARIYAATGDEALREKSAHLIAEWAKTLGPDGDCRMDLYAYDKLVGGLLDQHLYAHNPAALPLLQTTLSWAMRTFSTQREEATPDEINGRPHEWYTFAENLYRVYEVTKDPQLKAFADSYQDHAFWNQFAATALPPNFTEVHAYSHVNTFSSDAMAYEVTGDRTYLDILRHAYDFLQNTQCYATGGYGPMERLLPPNGMLGRGLEARNASFETVCGSWAGFKMARYLQEFTGEARYGDWIERLFYNGVGAALTITTGGKSFYYSDYRVSGGMKVYKVSRYSCCSGTYIQCLADYHNLIYYHTPTSLNVNLYVPSEVTWHGPTSDVHVVQSTDYPATETSTLRLTLDQPARFALKFRVPAWADGFTAQVNGQPVAIVAHPGTWAVLERTWQTGDRVEIRIPLKLRMVPVDAQHPRRVAVVRGPVVLVMDDWVFEEIPQLPEPKDLDHWLVPDPAHPGVFQIAAQNDKKLQARFRPFYAIGEVTPYRMYFDLDAPPVPVW